MSSAFALPNTATTFDSEPAFVAANDARATSVLLGVPSSVGEITSLVRTGVATVNALAVLPINDEAERRIERLLAAQRGTPRKVPLKAR